MHSWVSLLCLTSVLSQLRQTFWPFTSRHLHPLPLLQRSQNTWIPLVCSGMRYITPPTKHCSPLSCRKTLLETNICNVLSSGAIFVTMFNYRSTWWNLILSALSQNCLSFFLPSFLTSLIPSTFISVIFLLRSLSFSVEVVPFIVFLSTEALSHLPGYCVRCATLHFTKCRVRGKIVTTTPQHLTHSRVWL